MRTILPAPQGRADLNFSARRLAALAPCGLRRDCPQVLRGLRSAVTALCAEFPVRGRGEDGSELAPCALFLEEFEARVPAPGAGEVTVAIRADPECVGVDAGQGGQVVGVGQQRQRAGLSAISADHTESSPALR
ncbi:hypothetical protein ACIRQF_30445 [Streptomyces sp. NPDC101191]|uniref:hypothetical protein n=1 Tax=Streptomyces sp. NPDC101191 TaxID=3366126 RepID=UPI003821EF30